jgi:hypothetical protein
MKKLLLFPFLILLISCSNEEVPKDPIVGHWQLNSTIAFTDSGEPVERELHECYKNETKTFKNNGELYSVHYYLNEIMECKLNESATRTYKWTKVAEDTYNLKSTSPDGRDFKFSFPDSRTMWMENKGPHERDGVNFKNEVWVYKRK